MSRLVSSSIVLVVVGGFVAAMVAAQDQPRVLGESNDGASAPAVSDSGSVGLGEKLSLVGKSIASEYSANRPEAPLPPELNFPLRRTSASEPAMLLAADDSTGALRSVLKRSPKKPSTSSTPSTPTPPPSRSVQEPKPLTTVTPSAPDTVAPKKYVPSMSVSRDNAKVSSRRTFRSETPSVKPTIVASKPVSSRRAGLPTHTSDTPSDDALAGSVGALLRVDTIGSRAITVGEANDYVIRMSNAGVTEARGVVVRVAIPENVQVVSTQASDGNDSIQQEAGTERRLVWSLERLPARAERQLTLKLIPTANRPFDLTAEWAMSPVSATANIDVQQPLLEIALSGPGQIVHGETKVYSIVLSNPGTGDAKNVSIRLAMGNENADTLRVGVLEAGGNKKFDVEITARQAGPMQIMATATGANNLQAQAVEQIVVQRANLQIEALGSAHKFAGSVGTYQVRVTNIGDATARNVQIVGRLPGGVKYVKGIDTAVQEGDLLRWKIGELAPSTERSYRLFCELTADGDALFRFLASGDGGIEATSDVLTKVEALADLKLDVNDPKGPIPIGEEVTYEIQVTNRGTKAATQVQVVAQFSEGIEPIAAGGVRADLVPGQVVFQPISRIGPGEITKLSIKARADTEGNHVFRAEVQCADPETKLIAEDTTRYFGEDSLTAPKTPAVASPSDKDANAPRVGTKPLWFGSGSKD